VHLAVKLRDIGVALLQVKGAGNRNIAHVSDTAKLVWVESGDMMDTTYQARRVANLAWPVALTRAVFHPAVKWHADEPDIQSRWT
jgi:hypothetical protein